jgi:hypothetical protein
MAGGQSSHSRSANGCAHLFGHNEMPFHRSVHRPFKMAVAEPFSAAVVWLSDCDSIAEPFTIRNDIHTKHNSRT